MFRSKHPRDIFNEIKWRFDLAKCKVHYIHRGAPDDMKIVDGSLIMDIGRSFLVLHGAFEDVYIPYHRVLRIEYEDQIVFDRKSLKNPESGMQERKI